MAGIDAVIALPDGWEGMALDDLLDALDALDGGDGSLALCDDCERVVPAADVEIVGTAQRCHHCRRVYDAYIRDLDMAAEERALLMSCPWDPDGGEDGPPF